MLICLPTLVPSIKTCWSSLSPASDPLATFLVSDFSWVKIGGAGATSPGVVSDTRNGSAMNHVPSDGEPLHRPGRFMSHGQCQGAGMLYGGRASVRAEFQCGVSCGRTEFAQGINRHEC